LYIFIVFNYIFHGLFELHFHELYLEHVRRKCRILVAARLPQIWRTVFTFMWTCSNLLG